MSYEDQLIREATGQGRDFDEAPPAPADIEPNETSNQQGKKHWLLSGNDNCPNSWCDGHLNVKNPKHPRANVRCDNCSWTMYLSNHKRLDERALEAKRKREQMLANL